MNWYGCVPELVPDCESQTPSAQRSMRNLSWFQSAILKSTVLVKGLVTIVVVPSVEDGEDAEQELNRDTVEAREEVVAVALWLPPGKTLDMGPVTFLRSGIMKVIQGWGLTGAKVRACAIRLRQYRNDDSDQVVLHVYRECYGTSLLL